MNNTYKTRFSWQFLLLLSVSFLWTAVLYRSIAGPLAAQKKLASRAAHDSTEAVAIAEEAMKLSGRAGVHKFPLYPIDQIYFLSLGDFPNWLDPDSFTREYEPRAAAWREDTDSWLVLFYYNKKLHLSGCGVQVLKAGGYRYKFDPDYSDYHFDHKIGRSSK